MELTIDREFADLCPPLSDEEKNILLQSLRDDGCREPLVVWANHNDILLDGHTRYGLCIANDIPFKIKAMTFATRADASIWVLRNQLGRRNLTDENRTFTLGKLYKALKLPSGGDRVAQRHSDVLLPATEIAQKQGVSVKTLQRAEVFADAVDTIAETAPEVKQEILAGKSGIPKKAVPAIAALPVEERPAAIEQAKRKPKTKGMSDAKAIESGLKGYRLVLQALDHFKVTAHHTALQRIKDFFLSKQ